MTDPLEMPQMIEAIKMLQGTGQYRGTVKPLRPNQFSTPPKFQHACIIGKEGKLFSQIRVWVHGASLRFNDVAIFISLKNANSSAFAKVSSEDLKELWGWLGNVIQQVDEILPGLEHDRENVERTMQFYQQVQAMGQPSNGDYNDSDFTPDDNPEE